MASLRDFFNGMPVTPDPFQAIVDYLDDLRKEVRLVWERNPTDSAKIKKDTADGDNVVVAAGIRAVGDMSLSASQERDINIPFPIKFTKAPAVSVQPASNKPIFCSISDVTTDSCTVTVRAYGGLDGQINIRAIHYIAIGPKADSP